ncbi:HAD family hydrolase [Lyngbya sp. CCY1209]|uniref:HAD family hydrolase n=1 Tax=Lyngbya sp. CCY1209 TaxID=2886103 RepID=UPI002D1FEE79|nr:HAD family hydrolase [Lyngbya sp. CCY1209]MEB3883456.1 Cof-type HAD-IIB family hydrolase [Lyngbya sp. CCY1209]
MSLDLIFDPEFVPVWKAVRLVATDVDGTLTRDGKFTPDLLAAFGRLADAGVRVVLITGRSAGWVQGLHHYFPVAGAIAENGGIFYSGKQDDPELLTIVDNLAEHRRKLSGQFELLKAEFPDLQESTDNRFRITDWTFDVAGLGRSQLEMLANLCDRGGWGFTYSTVQCHIKPPFQDKATGLRRVLSRYFSDLEIGQVVTVGDSPNDESLFDGNQFPHSVGVANILDYCDRLQYQPAYVTSKAEVEGFCELAELLGNFYHRGTEDTED